MAIPARVACRRLTIVTTTVRNGRKLRIYRQPTAHARVHHAWRCAAGDLAAESQQAREKAHAAQKHLKPPPPDFDENPEWTDADFARARPFNEGFPKTYRAWKDRGGRPRVANPKKRVGLRLAPDVVDGIRATGKGYNARVEEMLRKALARGHLSR